MGFDICRDFYHCPIHAHKLERSSSFVVSTHPNWYGWHGVADLGSGAARASQMGAIFLDNFDVGRSCYHRLEHLPWLGRSIDEPLCSVVGFGRYWLLVEWIVNAIACSHLNWNSSPDGYFNSAIRW